MNAMEAYIQVSSAVRSFVVRTYSVRTYDTIYYPYGCQIFLTFVIHHDHSTYWHDNFIFFWRKYNIFYSRIKLHTKYLFSWRQQQFKLTARGSFPGCWSSCLVKVVIHPRFEVWQTDRLADMEKICFVTHTGYDDRFFHVDLGALLSYIICIRKLQISKYDS